MSQKAKLNSQKGKGKASAWLPGRLFLEKAAYFEVVFFSSLNSSTSALSNTKFLIKDSLKYGFLYIPFNSTSFLWSELS